jgi:stage II sporulation protein D
MKAPVIQVGILSESEVRFELKGSYSNHSHGKYLSGSYTVRLQNGALELETGNQLIVIGEKLLLQPDHPGTDSFVLHEVTIGINFHWQKKEDQEFRGNLKLLSVADKITVINELPVEDYLISVISSEMSATSSLELLKAHAVISRSWLLAQIEKGLSVRTAGHEYQSAYYSDDELMIWYDREDHVGFDVCADDHCQRYQGITRASTTLVELAVRQTEGEVLIHGNRLCDTRFSKCCGGVTELFGNTWEPVDHPYLQRVYDNARDIPEAHTDLTREEDARAWIMTKPVAFCNTTDKDVLCQVLNDYDQTTHDFYRWNISYAAPELGELIKSRIGIDFGVIRDLVPMERGVSGRIIRLKIVGANKTMIIGKELEIRKALSATHLYSSAFVVEKTGTGESCRFVLHGAGWGHGVGLCQIGAAVMGAKGYRYRDILLHYFRGAELERRY